MDRRTVNSHQISDRNGVGALRRTSHFFLPSMVIDGQG